MRAEQLGFELRAVAHLVRPWGAPIRDLEQLRAGIGDAPAEVLFHHAVQYQLRHAGAGELPPDDFSAWIGGVVQDAETAERLSFAVQSQRSSPDAIRSALLGVLDAGSKGSDGVPVWISGPQYQAWKHTQLVIDVVPGRGGGFSVEAPEGVRFLSRGRVFTDDEQAELAATPVITGAAYELGERPSVRGQVVALDT